MRRRKACRLKQGEQEEEEEEEGDDDDDDEGKKSGEPWHGPSPLALALALTRPRRLPPSASPSPPLSVPPSLLLALIPPSPPSPIPATISSFPYRSSPSPFPSHPSVPMMRAKISPLLLREWVLQGNCNNWPWHIHIECYLRTRCSADSTVPSEKCTTWPGHQEKANAKKESRTGSTGNMVEMRHSKEASAGMSVVKMANT